MPLNNLEKLLRDIPAIRKESDGFYFIPGKNSGPALDTIFALILDHRIMSFDIPGLCRLLSDDFETGADKPVLIGRELIQEFSRFEDHIRVEVSDDAMRADLIFSAESDATVFRADMCHWCLLQAGIRYGVSESDIRSGLLQRKTRFTAACGKQPESSADAELIFHEHIFRRQNEHPYILTKIDKGEILAQKLPAAEGTAGIDVFGNQLPSTGADIQFPPGENTYLGTEGLTLYSGVSGYIEYDGESLSVREQLIISQDIDYNAGEVHFAGPIIIHGDVRSGHMVWSEEDIEIYGCVEGANVVSTAGSLRVHNGINGLERSKIEVGKHVYADYIQDAHIIAGGNVVINRYVTRSDIESNGPVTILGDIGLVRGGITWSEQRIETNVAGSTACIPTTFIIRPKLSAEDQRQVHSLEARQQTLESHQQSIRRRLDFLSLLSKRQHTLADRHQQEVQLLSEELIGISQEILRIEDQRRTLESVDQNNMNYNRTLVQINKKIYPGVRFLVGKEELLVQEEIDGAEVRLMNDHLFLKKYSKPLHYEQPAALHT